MNSRKIQVKFGKVEQFNSSFSKCSVAIAYHGDNRNQTSISKEVFEQMIPSLYGVPIVGEWSKQEDDFKGHGGKIEITDDGVEYIDTTVPIGFIDSQAKVWWENITEADGSINEYLFTDCILWSGRYENVARILENNNSQSMEINVESGHVRDDGYYEIESGEFSALCVLGADTEPCFQSSAFKQFNLDKEVFKTEFNLMMEELKESIKGGENLKKEDIAIEENIEQIEPEVELEEVVNEEVFEEEIIEDVDNNNLSKANDAVEKAEETETQLDIDDARETVNALEDGEEKDSLIARLDVVQEKIDGVEDPDEEDEGAVGGTNDDYLELLDGYKKLELENVALKEEVIELKEFKSNTLMAKKEEDINEIFAKYSTLLEKSDMEDLVENSIDMDLDVLEKELSFRLVQKKFNFNKVDKKDSAKISIVEDRDVSEPYGSASIYFNK